MKKKKQTITTPSLWRLGMIKSLLCVLVALTFWPATSWAQFDLQSNMVFSDGSTVYVQGTQTIKLNGHDIILNGNAQIIVSPDATLTIEDNGSTTRYWSADDNYSEKKYRWYDPQDVSDDNHTHATTGGCIMGHDGEYPCIVVYPGATLILNGGNIVGNHTNGYGGGIDVQGTCIINSGAKICGNSAYLLGGGIYVNGGSCTIESGATICDNSASNGGGVYLKDYGTLIINGGCIENNSCEYDGQGGGVYFEGGTLNLSGAAKITGNTLADGTTSNNLYFSSGKVATITDALTGASIGVTMETPGTFTSGLSGNGNASNFTSDETSMGVGLTAGGEAYLGTLYTIGTSATHGSISTSPATSALSGVTITVTPTPDDGYALTSLTYTPTGGSATAIDQTTKQFTMPAANVTIVATFLLELTSENVSVPSAVYNGSSQTAEVKCGETDLVKGTDYTVTGTDSRTDAGTTESFTITGTGDYTGTVSGLTFTINPKSVTIPTAVTGLMWTGEEWTGVADGEDYTVTNGTATDIGNYTATAALNNTTNYKWSDETTADKVISWRIGAMLFEAGATSDWKTWYNNADITVSTDVMDTYVVVTDETASESTRTVTVTSTDGKIYKNTPMLLKRKEGVTSAISVNASEMELTIPNELYESLSNEYIGGVSSFANYLTGTVYLLAGSEFVRAKVTSTTTFDKSKCFIYLTPSNANNSRLYIVGDGPMGIDLIVTDGGNDTWYTIGGRKLSKQPKQPGVYISNGKKVIVK